MFTGIVQAVGKIQGVDACGEDVRLRVHAGSLALSCLRPGDSVAVNGVCLTAVDISSDGFWTDVSGETMARTTLGALRPGDAVNLEKSLTLSTPLGGHLVTGHVDGVGEVTARRPAGRSVRFQILAPASLAHYIARNGSICVDGVSLTVNAVDGAGFGVNIVPHTFTHTTLGTLQPSRRVNLEVDIVARYLERLLLGPRAAEPGSGLSRAFLAAHGFLRE